MFICCGPKCDSAPFKNIPGLSFHKFPKNERLCNAWIKNMKLVGWKPFSGAVLCSRHFEDCMFDRSSEEIRLRTGAIPTIFAESPVPYPTMKINNINTTNNNTEKVLVLKPIIYDSSGESSDDRVDSSFIRVDDSDSSNDIEDSSNVRNDSSNVRCNGSSAKEDSSNASDGNSETDSCFETPIEIVTLPNSIGNRPVRDCGVQTKNCNLNITNMKKKIMALRVQVKRRDVTIKKLQQALLKIKSESYKKNTINLICIDDMDAYVNRAGP